MTKIMIYFKETSFVLPIVIGLFLCVFLIIGIIWDLKRSRLEAYDELNHTATTIRRVLAGSIKSEVRRGQIRKWRLVAILENVIATTNLKIIEIRKGNKVLLHAGAKPNKEITSFISSPKGNILKNDMFFFWSTVKFQECPVKKERSEDCRQGKGMGSGQGRGRGWFTGNTAEPDSIDFSKSTQLLVLGLNPVDYYSHLKSAQRRITITFIIAFIAIIVFVCAWIFSIKQHMLTQQYEKIKLHSEQLEVMGLAAVGLAHEIKNPLSIIRGISQKVLGDDKLKLCHENACKILDQSDIATERLSDFINYAKMREPSLRKIRLSETVEKIYKALEPDFQDKEVQFINDIDDCVILTDADMFSQILVNLLLNSLHASKKGQTVKISVEKEKNLATLKIIDEGKGISEDLLGEIFKPYVSGDPNGHGIGLSVVKRRIDELNWVIKINSKVNQGATVTITNIEIVD